MLLALSGSSITPSKYLFTVSTGDTSGRTFRINEDDGSLSLISTQATATSGLRATAHPTLSVFYVPLNAVPGGIDAFAFDPATGVLSPRVTQRTPGGENFSHIAMVHPGGNFILYSIVQSVTRFYKSDLSSGLPGAPVVVSTATTANSQLAGLLPNGNYLYLGRASGGLERFSVAADGTMVDLSNTIISGAAIAGRITFSPNSDFLFTVSSANQVASFSVDGSGNLNAVSLFPAGVTSLSNALVNPLGNRFYVLANGTAIQTYTVASNGALTLLNQQAIATGIDFMCMDRSGRFLYAGQAVGAGDLLYYYRIDSSGIPEPKGNIVVGNTMRSCSASFNV